MPRIDIDAVPAHRGAGYPAPFGAPCAGRLRRRLGDAAGIEAFGADGRFVRKDGTPYD